MVVAYFVIGVILIGWTTYRQAVDDKEQFKVDSRNPLFWLVGIGCVILWPILVASAIYKIVRIFHLN